MPTVFELLGGKRRMSLPQTVQIKSHRGKKIITYEDADLSDGEATQDQLHHTPEGRIISCIWCLVDLID